MPFQKLKIKQKKEIVSLRTKYSNPEIETVVNKWGNFNMDEMDVLFPKIIGTGS